MAEPFLAEIRIVSFDFPPKGWAMCNGQFLPINQNQALFSLLGTTYGGNGQTTFALPNLQGRVPLHVGQSLNQGQALGTTAETITSQTMPTHVHSLQANSTTVPAVAASGIPTGKLFAQPQLAVQGGGTAPVNLYGPPNALTAMAPGVVSNTGGSQPHNNMMPYLVLNFVIALQGIFPSRN